MPASCSIAFLYDTSIALKKTMHECIKLTAPSMFEFTLSSKKVVESNIEQCENKKKKGREREEKKSSIVSLVCP